MTTPSEPPQDDPWQQAPGMTPEQGQPWAPPPPGAPPPPPGGPGYGAPPGYPGGYGGAPPGYGGYRPAPSNGMAIAAMVLGIVGLLSSWFILGGLLGLIGVILGFVARGKVKRGESTAGGMAIAGIVTGIIAVVIAGIILVFVGIFGDKINNYSECLQDATTQAEQQACADEFGRSFQD